jgi:type I restriction-modification system DNA methylase subunit
MDHAAHNKIVSFIWSIADDCLRDVYVRGKYRDVILPMFVLRRLDCLLEPSKDAVRELSESTDNIVQMITQEIRLIKEYRSVLISNAVTGKIKI